MNALINASLIGLLALNTPPVERIGTEDAPIGDAYFRPANDGGNAGNYVLGCRAKLTTGTITQIWEGEGSLSYHLDGDEHVFTLTRYKMVPPNGNPTFRNNLNMIGTGWRKDSGDDLIMDGRWHDKLTTVRRPKAAGPGNVKFQLVFDRQGSPDVSCSTAIFTAP